MTEYFAAVLLGLVQGLTEFLPVSSSGHLIITSALLHLEGEGIKTFEVVIQLGSVLAVLVLYWPRFLGLLKITKDGTSFAGIRGLYLLFLTSLPASLMGFMLHSQITRHLFNPVSVAVALAVGALFIFFAEHITARRMSSLSPTAELDDITPRQALGVGCFQCLALWPGFSRSTSTIAGGLLLGLERSAAAEYSFIAAVPIMMGAGGLSLYSGLSALSAADIPFFAIGTAVSFFSALFAIKGLIKLISRISFRPFAWYRLCIAPFVLWFWL